jgi:hypothetical protein
MQARHPGGKAIAERMQEEAAEPEEYPEEETWSA